MGKIMHQHACTWTYTYMRIIAKKSENKSYQNPGIKIKKIQEQKLQKLENKSYKNLGNKITKI
jgi:hypothetical protein